MNNIITIEHLNHVYQEGTPFRLHALENISLNIKKGEITAVIGPTGSGKSTLIQHFNGILKPTSGKIFVNGRNIHEKNTKTKNRDTNNLCFEVGLVFQYPEYQLFEETVFEDIAFGPKNMKLTTDEIEFRVKRAMEWMELDYQKIKDRSPFTLSGGEMRRVALAGVLAMEPKVLVLDEPTAGLDPRGCRELFRRIIQLRNELDMTLVMVSHEMGDVVNYAEHIILMKDGRIAADGTVTEIFKDTDTILRAGLELPPHLELLHRLKNKGFHVKTDVVGIDETVKEIISHLKECQSHRT